MLVLVVTVYLDSGVLLSLKKQAGKAKWDVHTHTRDEIV